MNIPQLLAELRARDVDLWAEGGTLRYSGPDDVLSPRVLAAMKASKRELLALLAASDAPEVEPQVLAGSASPSAPQPVGVDVGALYDPEAARVVEIVRPDIREPLSLAALDEPPVEAPPLPDCVWVRDLGVWQRGPWRVPTAATRANALRLYEAQRARG